MLTQIFIIVRVEIMKRVLSTPVFLISLLFIAMAFAHVVYADSGSGGPTLMMEKNESITLAKASTPCIEACDSGRTLCKNGCSDKNITCQKACQHDEDCIYSCGKEYSRCVELCDPEHAKCVRACPRYYDGPN